jgi:hypothetical protein
MAISNNWVKLRDVWKHLVKEEKIKGFLFDENNKYTKMRIGTYRKRMTELVKPCLRTSTVTRCSRSSTA